VESSCQPKRRYGEIKRLQVPEFGCDYNDDVMLEHVPGYSTLGPRETRLYQSNCEWARRLREEDLLKEFPFTHDAKDHITPMGVHHVYYADHVRLPLLAKCLFRALMRDAASRLLDLMHCGFILPNEGIRSASVQGELWMTASTTCGFVVLADVTIDKDEKAYVKLESSIMLALSAAQAKSQYDRAAQKVYEYNKNRRGTSKVKFTLPAIKPQVYLVDNATHKVFCLTDGFLKSHFGEKPNKDDSNVLYELKCADKFEVTQAPHGLEGSLTLVSTTIHTQNTHRNLNTELCLGSVAVIQNLTEETASLVSVITMYNLTGYESQRNVPIFSLVFRPSGTYTENTCPICNRQSNTSRR